MLLLLVWVSFLFLHRQSTLFSSQGWGKKKIFTTLIYVHHKAIYTNQMFEKQGTDKEKKKETFKRSRRPTRFPNGAPLFATQDSSAQAHRNSRRECLPSTASCETRAGNRKKGESIGKGNARAVVVAAVNPGVCTLGGGYYGEEMYTRQLLSHLKFAFETGCSEPLHLKLLPYSHKGGAHSSAAARNLVGKRYPPRQHRNKNGGWERLTPPHFLVTSTSSDSRQTSGGRKTISEALTCHLIFPPFGSVPPIRKSQFLLNKK